MTVLAGIAVVALIAAITVAVAPRWPRALTPDDVTGVWSSETLSGEITLGENGKVTVTDLGVDLTNPFGNKSDFDASGTWRVSTEPDVVLVRLNDATVFGEVREMTNYGLTLQFSRLNGVLELYVTDFNTEQPHHFSRHGY